MKMQKHNKYTTTLKTDFFCEEIINLEGVYQKIRFQWLEMQFACGWMAKMRRKSYV